LLVEEEDKYSSNEEKNEQKSVIKQRKQNMG
jgi:hypothetical protein